MKVRCLPLVVACVIAFTSVPSLAHEPKKPEDKAMASHSPGSMELHRVMSEGQKMPMPMTGNVDKDFAAMMTMHHQQAIKMVDVLLQHGSNAELKAMATKMKIQQQEEITKLAPYTK